MVKEASREARELLNLFFMQPTQPPLRTVFLPKNISQKRLPQPAKHSDFRMTNYVVDEINAYAVIRDIALAEAEKEPSSLNLERLRIANDFVKDCLKPARPPYTAQHLPETDAARERDRCRDVRVRLSLLRAHLAALSRDHAHAA
jgi:hypothetical protein